jgi:hypothetical protein
VHGSATAAGDPPELDAIGRRRLRPNPSTSALTRSPGRTTYVRVSPSRSHRQLPTESAASGRRRVHAAILVDGYPVWSRGFDAKEATTFRDVVRDKPTSELTRPRARTAMLSSDSSWHPQRVRPATQPAQLQLHGRHTKWHFSIEFRLRTTRSDSAFSSNFGRTVPTNSSSPKRQKSVETVDGDFRNPDPVRHAMRFFEYESPAGEIGDWLRPGNNVCSLSVYEKPTTSGVL